MVRASLKASLVTRMPVVYMAGRQLLVKEVDLTETGVAHSLIQGHPAIYYENGGNLHTFLMPSLTNSPDWPASYNPNHKMEFLTEIPGTNS